MEWNFRREKFSQKAAYLGFSSDEESFNWESSDDDSLFYDEEFWDEVDQFLGEEDFNDDSEYESEDEVDEELVLRALRIEGEVLDEGEIVQILEKAGMAPIPLVAAERESTQKPIQQPNQELTQEPTQKPTQKQTQKSTLKPIEKPTKKSVQKSTHRPAQKSTQKATQKTTQKLIQKPTQELNQKTTQKQTKKSNFKREKFAEWTAPDEEEKKYWEKKRLRWWRRKRKKGKGAKNLEVPTTAWRKRRKKTHVSMFHEGILIAKMKELEAKKGATVTGATEGEVNRQKSLDSWIITKNP